MTDRLDALLKKTLERDDPRAKANREYEQSRTRLLHAIDKAQHTLDEMATTRARTAKRKAMHKKNHKSWLPTLGIAAFAAWFISKD